MVFPEIFTIGCLSRMAVDVQAEQLVACSCSVA
jgi:hypothetical protein